MATGAALVVVGAAAAVSDACLVEPAVVEVLAAAAAAVVLVAAVTLGRLMTMAAAPSALAAPAPRVIADTQASPFLRAS